MRTLLSLSLFIILLNSNAQAQQLYKWARSSAGSGNEWAWSVTTDKQNNVYHTGTFSDTADFDPGSGVANLTSNGQDDIYFAKYDSNGNYIWARSIGGGQNDQARQIITDDTGNVYITGHFTGTVDLDAGSGVDTFTGIFNDIFFAKYDSSGNYVWGKHLEGNGGSAFQRMAIDKAGNIYLAGDLFAYIDFDPGPGTAMLNFTGANLFFAKYDNNGNYIRTFEIGDNNMQIIAMNGMGLDAEANMYITGQFSANGLFDFDPGAAMITPYSAGLNAHDVYMAKYDSAGNFIWVRSLVDSSTTMDNAVSMAVAENGDLFIGGYYASSNVDFDPGPGVVHLAGGPDIFIARYDSAGNYVYAKSLNNTSGTTYWMGTATDGAGNFYLTGTFSDTIDFDPGPGVYDLGADTNNVFYAKYDNAGQLEFAYGIGGMNACTTWSIALDTSNNAYIAGYYTGTVDFDPSTSVANLTAMQGKDMMIVKFGEPTVNKVAQVGSADDILIYPNPAMESISILSGDKINEVKITNVAGQVLHSSTLSTIDIRNFSPGMYFIQISNQEEVFIKKFVKE